MSATAAQIARLRRMVGNPSESDYSDNTLQEYIERYPLLDERGEEPYTWDTSTEPPTQDANEAWIPTYDLNAAAADVWEEKASAVADRYDLSDQGRSQSRSQMYEHYMAQARHYRSRRVPRSMRVFKWPKEDSDYVDPRVWIGNLPEPRD